MKLAFELEIPEGAVDKSDEAELVRSVREQTVLKLYSEQRVTTGEAAEMLGLTRIEFLDLLGRTGVGFQVELDDEDFTTLRQRRDAQETKSGR
jgi:predicted HTH domain antitoxin